MIKCDNVPEIIFQYFFSHAIINKDLNVEEEIFEGLEISENE